MSEIQVTHVTFRPLNVQSKPNMVAQVNVVLNECFAVHGLMIRGRDGNVFYSAPRRSWKNQDGSFGGEDLAHPITSELANHMRDSIQEAFQRWSADNEEMANLYSNGSGGTETPRTAGGDTEEAGQS